MRHDRGLLLIAAFKLVEALLFAAVGFGALHLLHKDIGDHLTRMANHLPESRFIDFLLHRAELINDRLLRQIGAVGFVYAALNLIEGTGLYLEKRWGEYLTLCITASLIPWEIFEILRKVTLIRASLLTLNALVFFYLLNLVMLRQRSQKTELDN